MIKDKKLLLVVDMQNDFVNGSLGSSQAASIVPNLVKKIAEYKRLGYKVIFTQDTHDNNYLTTQEGKLLPIMHCVKGTKGYEIISELDVSGCEVVEKETFGSLNLVDIIKKYNGLEEIEICGLCTDICVVSNALILKAAFPEIKITVDAMACAGITEESHKAALLTMKMCQVNVVDEG